jgi:HSP20 family molecular chaperone IbpA
VNEEQINAKVENGILTIELPKVQKVEGKTTRQIEIA